MRRRTKLPSRRPRLPRIAPQFRGVVKAILFDQRTIVLDHLAGRLDALGIDRALGSANELRAFGRVAGGEIGGGSLTAFAGCAVFNDGCWLAV